MCASVIDSPELNTYDLSLVSLAVCVVGKIKVKAGDFKRKNQLKICSVSWNGSKWQIDNVPI